jgi:hypothetical protein
VCSSDLGVKNEYYELLTQLKKPYLSTTDALNKIPSSLKQNTLSIEDCFTYFNQIKSGDPQAMRAAMEAVVMYNTDKYLPLQVLFYSYYFYIQQNTKSGILKPSNKLKLFYEANKNLLIGTHIMDNVFVALSSFSAMCATHSKTLYKNADWALIRKFLLSKEFHDAASNSAKYNGIKIHGVWFEFVMPPLAGPIEQVENKSIAEFVL